MKKILLSLRNQNKVFKWCFALGMLILLLSITLGSYITLSFEKNYIDRIASTALMFFIIAEFNISQKIDKQYVDANNKHIKIIETHITDETSRLSELEKYTMDIYQLITQIMNIMAHKGINKEKITQIENNLNKYIADLNNSEDIQTARNIIPDLKTFLNKLKNKDFKSMDSVDSKTIDKLLERNYGKFSKEIAKIKSEKNKILELKKQSSRLHQINTVFILASTLLWGWGGLL